MKNLVSKSNWKNIAVKIRIYNPSKRSLLPLSLRYIIFPRFSRIDRDARGYESRLKQYENEIADVKGRCDAMTFDIKRKIEENEV